MSPDRDVKNPTSFLSFSDCNILCNSKQFSRFSRKNMLIQSIQQNTLSLFEVLLLRKLIKLKLAIIFSRRCALRYIRQRRQPPSDPVMMLFLQSDVKGCPYTAYSTFCLLNPCKVHSCFSHLIPIMNSV